MRILEQQGKTVDDAITKALEELNVSRDQISVEILEEGSRGLFGLMGARPAKIRVKVAQDASYNSIKEELRAVRQAESQESKPQAKESKPQTQESKPQMQESKPQMRESKPREPKPRERKASETRDKKAQDASRTRERSPERQERRERSDEQPEKDLVNESPKEYDEKDIQQITTRAKDSLGVILGNLQIEYTVEVKRRDDQILMNIHCDNENFLIGRRGTTLDAVQYLVNRIANKDIEEKIQVVLDTSDYRTNRKQRLEKLALRLSRRVKTTGKSVTVAPMNPHDRRIIHLTLQDDSSIRTLSRGTGFMRRIIISSNRSSSKRRKSPPSSPSPSSPSSE